MHSFERFLGQPWHVNPQVVPTLLQRREEWGPRIAASADPKALSIADWIHQRQPMVVTGEGVAIIEACGSLGRGLVTVDKLLGDTDYDDLIAEFSEAVADERVKGILFAIDSGGGSVVGAQECREAVAAAAAQKPVVAATCGMLCSAAYEIAAPASLIVASPSSIVGSIGTITSRWDFSGYYEQFGVKVDFITGTKADLKAMYRPEKPMSDMERAEIQRFTDRWNEDFIAFVRSCRPGVEDSTMRGQCFDAREGKDLGLIDELGCFDEAMDECLALARGVDTDPNTED